MHAFVQNTSVSVTRHTLPQAGLQSVCGTMPSLRRDAISNANANANTNGPGPVRMMLAPNYDITLQTLVYNPTPTVSGVEDKDLICYNVWKQVFGNAYVMESERADAYKAESMFRAGQIPLREFVRAVAKSGTYRRRFFECCGPYRAVELNFKHLLGRGPNSQAEVSEHVQRIANEGFEADIDSYIDSLEYDSEFGDDYVPFMRFKGTYPTIEEFNRMCTIYSSPGTTDKSLARRARALGIENPNFVLSLDGAGVPSRLVSTIAMNSTSSFVNIKKGIPSRADLEFGQSSPPSPTVSEPVINQNAISVRRVEIVPGSYMYLSPEEAKEYDKNTLEQDKVVSFAEAEISDAQMQIELLQAKIAELSLIK